MKKNKIFIPAILLLVCIAAFGIISLMIRKQTTGETGTAGDFANILYIGDKAKIMYIILIVISIVWTSASSILKVKMSMKVLGFIIQMIGYFLRLFLFTLSMFKGVDWYMFSGSRLINMQVLALLCILILPFIVAPIAKNAAKVKRVQNINTQIE